MNISYDRVFDGEWGVPWKYWFLFLNFNADMCLFRFFGITLRISR